MNVVKNKGDIWFVEMSEDKRKVHVIANSQPKYVQADWDGLAKYINNLLNNGYIVTDSTEDVIGDYGTYTDDHKYITPSVDTGMIEVVSAPMYPSPDFDHYQIHINIKKED